MIEDVQCVLFDKNTPTSVATVASNSYDTGPGAVSNNLGRGRVIRVKVTVDTTFTSGGAGTLAVNYVQSANSDLSSPDILASVPVTALAGLVAGNSLLDIVAPDNTKRYVGFQAIVATAAMTAGALTAQLLLNTNSPSLYPAAT